MKVTARMKKNAPHLAAYWSKQNRGGEFSSLVKKKAKKRKAKHGAASPKRKKRTHHHTESHVAKKKKRKHGGKRRGGGSARRRSHRRHNHGGFGSGGGVMTDLILAGIGLGWGFVESKMKKEQDFILNKLPTPISFLGRVGNLTLATYLLSYLVPGQWKGYARKAAKVGAIITGYQLGRKGEAFKEGSEVFAISGPEDFGVGGDEGFLGEDDIGALDAEMSGHHVRGELDLHVDDDDDAHDIDIHAIPDGHPAQVAQQADAP